MVTLTENTYQSPQKHEIRDISTENVLPVLLLSFSTHLLHLDSKSNVQLELVRRNGYEIESWKTRLLKVLLGVKLMPEAHLEDTEIQRNYLFNTFAYARLLVINH